MSFTLRRLRILLVEDHQTVRQGLKLLLNAEADFEVADEARDGAEAIARAQRADIDVVVMDLCMPGMSGLLATRQLMEMRPDLAIVTLTRHSDRTYLRELLNAGTLGYVLKQSPHVELFRAIRAAAGGHQYVDPQLTHHLAAPFIAPARRRGQAPPAVTPRESEVVRLGARGFSNKEIARQLEVSVKTVELHKTNAMHKLGLRGRIELVQYALHQGWLHDV